MDRVRPRRLIAILLGASVAVLGAVLAPSSGWAAQFPPMLQRTAEHVTADALPTVQINGVAWRQTISGNRVYVAGSFTNARPAGSAAGVNTTPRSNFLAYDLATGVLNTSFAPSFNAQTYVATVSPDGSTLYVGGQFTTVNGQTRNRVAAFDVATGQLKSSFAPNLNNTVRTIVATDTTVYVGGIFTTANGQSRQRLAAFRASDGALLQWAPSADSMVADMVMSPDKSRLIVGGSFSTMNGADAKGMTAIDPTTAAALPWAVNQTLQNYGNNAAILSLRTDGDYVYGTGYTFGTPGNLEGAFAAEPTTGNIVWVEACHGDTYGIAPVGQVVYTVSHAHDCSQMGAFPNSDPWSINQKQALSFTEAPMGTDTNGYPTPSMFNWYPRFTVGSYTGQSQAAWAVDGNSQYVVMGGEFPSVNGTAQQGLVRFAVPSIAPKKIGPNDGGSFFKVSAISVNPGSARVSWQSNFDRDDYNLTYKVFRDGNTTTPVYQTTAPSTQWDRPVIGFIDTALAPGSTHSYRVYAYDADGNRAVSDSVSVTVVTGDSSASPYSLTVAAQGATGYWRLNETAGDAIDYAAFNDASVGTVVTRPSAGALLNEAANSGYAFDGTAGSEVTPRTALAGPDTFTVSAWFKTTSTSGGKIVGFGDKPNGSSSSYDRHVYLDDSGHVWFGVYPGGTRTLTSSRAYNDGEWHQVVASMGAAGMTLYVDGKQVGQRTDTTNGQPYVGYWRIGGDSIGGWPGQPSSSYFTGSIDEVAVFPTALTLEQVRAQYQASGRTLQVPQSPADPYGAAVWSDNPSMYWRLDDPAGSTAVADSSAYELPGSYQGGVTQEQGGALPSSQGTATSFDGSSGQAVADSPTSDPRSYTLESWVKTTSTSGGKIMGFGSSRSGNSGSYDRHVYMQDDGRVVFGVWTGQTNTITSPAPLNDGSWHHVVATQDTTAGMRLYVDGVLVGENPQTDQQHYDGYWRIGGDNTWGSSSSHLAGVIDEFAVYGTALPVDKIQQHYAIGASVPPANVAPVAAFTSSASGLQVSVDGSGSTDSDGQVVSYAWDFGDGSVGSGALASHAYAVSGTYAVTLSVTDDDGAVGSVVHQVSVTAPPANVAPVAAFTSSASGLQVSVDGSGSTDSDGQVVSYAWDFGDGSVGSGALASHAYAVSGTYAVTLSVTDDDGAVGSVVHQVSVTAPPAGFIVDSFERAVNGGLGTADVGGAWAIQGGSPTAFSVAEGTAKIKLSPGVGVTAGLAPASVNTTVSAEIGVDGQVTGGGIYTSLQVRKVGGSYYHLKIQRSASGAVAMYIERVVNGTTTTIGSAPLSGVTLSATDRLAVVFSVTGTGTTTLTAKAWKVGTPEPASAQLTKTDATASLQTAGTVGIYAYLSSSATTATTVRIDNLVAK